MTTPKVGGGASPSAPPGPPAPSSRRSASIAPPSDTPESPTQIAQARAITRYHDVLAAYVEKGGEDHLALADRMVSRGLVFGGRPICTALRPSFLLRSQLDLVTRAVRRFRAAVVKAKDRIVADPELLDQLSLSEGERRLFEQNAGFKSVGVFSRLDTILSGEDFQMVELNAEAGFGGAYSDRMTDLFEAFQPMREFARSRKVTPLYQGNSVMSALLDTWHEFGGTRVPRVAVVDWKDAETRTELDLVCERLDRHGIPALFVDPRELSFDGKALVAYGRAVDVVYRRLRTCEALARPDDTRALLEAYAAGAVCVVNSFRATLLEKKLLFAMLHDPTIQERFTPEEVLAVRAHVPWTRRVAEGLDTGPDGEAIDLLPWASEHRASLVLKPNDEVASRGVVMGANLDQSAWNRALAAALVEPSVLQRRVALPSSMFPEIGAAGELFFTRRYLEVDPYLLRGEARGFLTRLSATTLSNVTNAGAGTVPTFILEDGDG